MFGALSTHREAFQCHACSIMHAQLHMFHAELKIGLFAQIC